MLGVSYNLWLYNRVFFGPLNAFLVSYCDLNRREFFVLVPFVALMLLMGISPNLFLDLIHTSVSFSLMP